MCKGGLLVVRTLSTACTCVKGTCWLCVLCLLVVHVCMGPAARACVNRACCMYMRELIYMFAYYVTDCCNWMYKQAVHEETGFAQKLCVCVCVN